MMVTPFRSAAGLQPGARDVGGWRAVSSGACELWPVRVRGSRCPAARLTAVRRVRDQMDQVVRQGGMRYNRVQHFVLRFSPTPGPYPTGRCRYADADRRRGPHCDQRRLLTARANAGRASRPVRQRQANLVCGNRALPQPRLDGGSVIKHALAQLDVRRPFAGLLRERSGWVRSECSIDSANSVWGTSDRR